MSGNTLANASLNAFSVQPSEEKLITVPASLLQDLQDRIDSLEDKIVQQDNKITDLEATQDILGENDLNQLRLIAELRKATQIVAAPTPPQGGKVLTRIATIDEILKARGSTTLKELERILKISPQEMSRIMVKLDKRRYEIFQRAGDEREKVLRLKAQIV